ncbi:conserved hypothetical protein [Conexibacter woesei DSM 14684]|uniref:Uncharacterized protein n=2 Tax=Conexibacter TaxID=191494 RepID=D3FEA4_CONWI|nr:conserved hypothetical protein [Conexibacter woesei DSM 14684]
MLFTQADLADWLASLQSNCQAKISDASEDELLGADVDAWVAQVAEAFTVEPVVIRRDEVELEDVGESQVDVRYDQNRAIFDTTQPFLIPGRRAVIHIPFTGDETLLRCRPRQWSMSPPRAAIGKDEIKLFFEWPHDHKPPIKTTTDALIAAIEQHASWQQPDIEAHNRDLPGLARHAIATRRQRVLADREHLDGLGIPVRRSTDAPRTFSAPGITRRPSPTPPRQRAAASTPLEPTLVGEFYAHILGVVSAMARGMERTPGNYASWDEEQLRDALLVLLNTHYEGQATGETFNKSGKTDILIRVEDRNVFVAECKWWSGPAAFALPDREESSALDQLLGYTTWRDAKLALVMFVDRKDMGRVLAAARETLANHPAFEDWQQGSTEGELRCRVRLPDHEERRADLAVVFVHLPRD